MPTFTYVGLSESDLPVQGVVEAYDEIEAMEKAREICRVVYDVKEVKSRRGLLSLEITKPKAKQKNLSIMCAQFATIIQAGLPIARAVALVADQTADKYLKRVLKEVSSDVAAGHGLADSFESKGPELPRVFVETVRAGEESGRLPESFTRLHTYYDRRSKIAGKVASALTYPIFVLIIAVVVVAVMMVMVIPAIAGMVSSLGSDMPAITQFLINASDWVSHNIVLILVVLVLVVIAVRLYARTEAGKTLLAKLKLKIPLLGSIGVYSGASQFANTMGTLIASGLPMTHAVSVTARVMDNYVLSREVGRMQAGLEEGRTLGECMETCVYFPETLVEMTTVGEQTGALEETLATMGEFYDSETQRVTDRALSLMEPLLLVLMALFAGFIVIALYLPLFTMYASM